VGLGGLHAGADAFTDEFSLELSHCREDVQEKFARGI
jgi:hypothetical protein